MKRTIETIYYGELGEITYVVSEAVYSLEKDKPRRVERGYQRRRGGQWESMSRVERDFSKELPDTRTTFLGDAQVAYYKAVIMFLEAENAWCIGRERARFRQEMTAKGLIAPTSLEDKI